MTQIQDLISDSNKDFIIGSSSVVINDSDHATSTMHALSNPLPSSQQRGELPPPIVSGQRDAKNLEQIHGRLEDQVNRNVARATKGSATKKTDLHDDKTSPGADRSSQQEQQQMKRKKRQLFSNMESIQIMYD